MRVSNIAWNLGGLGIPLVIAAITIPKLIELIGVERFGLLAIAWGLIGFAGVFDLGVGRATTRYIASLRGRGRSGDAVFVVEVAGKICLVTGALGTLLFAIAIAADAHGYLKYPDAIHAEVTAAAGYVAIAIPVQALSAMFRGVNEAFENFRGINLVRVGLGAANFLGPFAVALFTTDVGALVATLLLSRLVALAMFQRLARACLRLQESPSTISHDSGDRSRVAKHLVTFGSWVSVSGVVSPLMMSTDRILIGTLISAAAVTAYAVPYELVIQTLIVAGAITTTLFPNLTSMLAGSRGHAMVLFNRWLAYAGAAMAIVAGAIVVLVPIVLPVWLGGEAPEGSVAVAQVLSVGLVPYTIGSMYLALVHALNRSDVTAKSHLLQAPCYLFLLYWAIENFGIVGAAWVWVARVTCDAAVLVAWIHLRNTEPRA